MWIQTWQRGLALVPRQLQAQSRPKIDGDTDGDCSFASGSNQGAWEWRPLTYQVVKSACRGVIPVPASGGSESKWPRFGCWSWPWPWFWSWSWSFFLSSSG